MNERMKRQALMYIRDCREEQVDDNLVIHDKQVITSIGVNYHMQRKEIAFYLAKGMREYRRGIRCFFGPQRDFVFRLLDVGVTKQTVRSWLQKYEDIETKIYFR